MSAFIAPIISVLGGLGGLFGGSKFSQTSNTDQTTSPVYDPASQAFKNLLLQTFTKQINGLPSQNQYTLAGTKNIQQGAQNASQSADDILASRGLSRTTAGANAAADTGYKEGQSLSSFLTNAPFTYQQQEEPILTGAGGFLSSLPVGQHTTGTTSTTGVGNQPVSPLAGFSNGFSSTLAGLLGQQQAQQSLGNILKSLAPTYSNPTPSVTPTSSGSFVYPNFGGG